MTTSTLTMVKSLYQELLDLEIDHHDIKDVITEMNDEATDFVVANYRFIHQDEIDQVLTEELAGDLYMLGCFNADFIADVTNLPLKLIQACQEADAYEALGEGIVSTCGVAKLASAYVDADGYGNHFGSYDGMEHEVGDYYAFRTN